MIRSAGSRLVDRRGSLDQTRCVSFDLVIRACQLDVIRHFGSSYCYNNIYILWWGSWYANMSSSDRRVSDTQVTIKALGPLVWICCILKLHKLFFKSLFSRTCTNFNYTWLEKSIYTVIMIKWTPCSPLRRDNTCTCSTF